MAQNVSVLVNVPCQLEKNAQPVVSGLSILNINEINWVGCAIQVNYILVDVLLLDLSVTEIKVLKSPAITVDSIISSCRPVSFGTHILILFLGAHTLKTIWSSRTIGSLIGVSLYP